MWGIASVSNLLGVSKLKYTINGFTNHGLVNFIPPPAETFCITFLGNNEKFYALLMIIQQCQTETNPQILKTKYKFATWYVNFDPVKSAAI